MHDSVFGPILAALLGECVALCSFKTLLPCHEREKKAEVADLTPIILDHYNKKTVAMEGWGTLLAMGGASAEKTI